jgi:hypothetical protein
MRKMVILFVACFLFFNSTVSFADSTDPLHIGADVVLVRPLGFVATVIGGGLFVVCLPFALTSGSVKNTADTLVGQPYRFTFKRPLGDFDEGSYMQANESEKKPKK